jgi:hypothetical protein
MKDLDKKLRIAGGLVMLSLGVGGLTMMVLSGLTFGSIGSICVPPNAGLTCLISLISTGLTCILVALSPVDFLLIIGGFLLYSIRKN